MRILLGGVVGALPKSRVDDISDVLFDMLQVSSLADVAAMIVCITPQHGCLLSVWLLPQ